MPASILIVEDEPDICALLQMTLSRAGHIPLCVADAQAAAREMAAKRPDLVLLDWMLPGISGLEYAKRLRQDPNTRAIPIIMLTARSTENDKISGLREGADDYVTKPFSPRELLARIEAVLRRRLPERSSAPLCHGGITLDPDAHQAHIAGHLLNLGPTEFRLLHFFMARPQRVHSRSALLDGVWGNQVFLDERTVDVHILRLRKALEPWNKDGLVQTVRGSGYRFALPESA